MGRGGWLAGDGGGAVSGGGYLPSQLASWLQFPSGDWPGLACPAMACCVVVVFFSSAVDVEVGGGRERSGVRSKGGVGVTKSGQRGEIRTRRMGVRRAAPARLALYPCGEGAAGGQFV